MIVRLEQEKTNFSLGYEFTLGESLVCHADAPFAQGNMTVTFNFVDSACKQLYFNPSDTKWGTSMKDRLSFKILANGEKIGSIVGATQKTGKLFGAYPYYQVEYRGEEYQLYAVGLGKNGIFLCGYKGDEQIFVAEKDRLVVNYQDTYTIYLEDERYFPLAALMLIYYDLTCYGDMLKLSVVSVKQDILNTVQKELIAKYNPAFIERVKRADGAV